MERSGAKDWGNYPFDVRWVAWLSYGRMRIRLREYRKLLQTQTEASVWNEIYIAVITMIGSGIAILAFSFVPGFWGDASIELKSLIVPAIGGLALASIVLFWRHRRRLWEEAHKLHEEQRIRLTPKLQLECGKHIRGSHVETPTLGLGLRKVDIAPCTSSSTSVIVSEPTGPEAMYMRIVVTVQCVGAVKNCKGTIDDISNTNGKSLLTQAIEIPFAMGIADDAFKKRIDDKRPAYLDVLWISKQDNMVHHPPSGQGFPLSVRFETIFKEVGEYYLDVIVSGDDTVSVRKGVRFDWTGNWETAELQMDKKTGRDADYG